MCLDADCRPQSGAFDLGYIHTYCDTFMVAQAMPFLALPSYLQLPTTFWFLFYLYFIFLFWFCFSE
jgi:hypothetical protein